MTDASSLERGLALVVDDQPIERLLMERLLAKEGFTTISAGNGQEALSLFEHHQPDLVFMDVKMPVMCGQEAARRIKASPQGRYTPIIFLTGLQDPDALHDCIQAGGDDFLNKPVNPRLLKSRIFALERIRRLYCELEQQNRDLTGYLEEERRNEALAQRVYSRVVLARNPQCQGLELYSLPAETFSGDLMLVCQLPDTSLRVLLADFTGHGLAAALGALPVSEVFHALGKKGASQAELLAEMNNKLCELLPDDRFMAATLIDFQPKNRQLSIWSGGMPEAWLFANQQLQTFGSTGMPLGILEDCDFSTEIRTSGCPQEARLLMLSDGLLDAECSSGERFRHLGFDDFIETWKTTEGLSSLLDQIIKNPDNRLQFDDDITLIHIDLNAFRLV